MNLKKKDISKKILTKFLTIGGISETRKSFFAKHLALMLKSGLTILDSLLIIIKSSKGKFKHVLIAVYKSVQSGNSLSSSFADFPNIFNDLFINATYAGEISGTLEENLFNISDHLKKAKETRDKVKGAMFYPVVVGIVALGIGLGIALFILPQITPLFERLSIDLPFATRFLIVFSNFVRDNGLAVVVGSVAIIFGLIVLLKQRFMHPLTHYFIIKFPIVRRISRQNSLSYFCRTLNLLLRSGINIDEALRITKDTTSNYYYKKALTQITKRISKGTKLSETLIYERDLFPLTLISMIKVGEESGSLEETLIYLAEYYESEVESSIKVLSSAVEPVLLVFIGLMVGGLALAVITPIYKITGNVR